jgi:hypothetical protein
MPSLIEAIFPKNKATFYFTNFPDKEISNGVA